MPKDEAALMRTILLFKPCLEDIAFNLGELEQRCTTCQVHDQCQRCARQVAEFHEEQPLKLEAAE
jgi:hypothetical protein